MSDQRDRVVVTGVGVICSLGHDATSCWQALCEGRSGIGPIELVDVQQLRSRNGAEVKGFDPASHFGSEVDMLDRFSQFAVVAARQARTDAGLQVSPENRSRIAIVMGTGVGGQSSQDAGFVSIYRENRPRPHPFTIPRTM